MSTVTNRTTQNPDSSEASSRKRPTFTPRRNPSQMPRSTTRVIWTMSQGATVQFGDVC